MDDTDDFVFPETLRLLNEFCKNSGPAFQPNDLSLLDQAHGAAPPCETQTKGKDRNSSLNSAGCSTLNIGNVTELKRKRAKFDESRRKKVANVRKKGACMRCRLLKISCSGTWPCGSCGDGVSSCHGRAPKYRWMHCVPFSMKEVDIYAMDSPCSQHLYDSILRDCDRSFEPVARWDLSAISSNCTNWITNSHLPANLDNFAWIFSSLNSERLLSSWVSPNMSIALRVLVEVSSVLHNWGCNASYAGYSAKDLWSIRSFAGSQVLQGLEAALSNSMLAKASQGELKALFLVAFGVTTAIGFSKSIIQLEKHRGPSASSSAGFFEDAQRQLIRVLIHHMLHIAEKAYLLDSQAIRDRLLDELTYSRWRGNAVSEVKIRYPPDSIFLATKFDRLCSAELGHGHHDLFHGVGNNNVSVELLRNDPPFESPSSCQLPIYQGVIAMSKACLQPSTSSAPMWCESCNGRLNIDGVCEACLYQYVDFDDEEENFEVRRTEQKPCTERV